MVVAINVEVDGTQELKYNVLKIFVRMYLEADKMKESVTAYADPRAREFLIDYGLIQTQKPERIPPELIPTQSGNALAKQLEEQPREKLEELFFALYPVAKNPLCTPQAARQRHSPQ